MNKQKTLTCVAAVLLTAANLAAVSHDVPGRAVAASRAPARITNLAPVQVRPSAADLRAAAQLTDNQAPAPTREAGRLLSQSLIGSQLAMPYYSFGNESGRISKE